MQSKKFSPGFKISFLDMIVLFVGVLATIKLAMIVWWWGFIVGFVIGHFFLFCNIIRLARSLELIWATIFIVLAGCTIILQKPGWLITICILLAVTTFIVLIEIQKPSYHGIFWKQINPKLENWWKSHHCTSVSPEFTDS